MSDIEINDLPAPFFARYLEDQDRGNMTREEMRSVRGGSMVTLAYPSDHVNAGGTDLNNQIENLVQDALAGIGFDPFNPNPPSDPTPPGGPWPVEPDGGTGGSD